MTESILVRGAMHNGDIEGGGDEELRPLPQGVVAGVGRQYRPVAASDSAVLQMSSVDLRSSSSSTPRSDFHFIWS